MYLLSTNAASRKWCHPKQTVNISKVTSGCQSLLTLKQDTGTIYHAVPANMPKMERIKGRGEHPVHLSRRTGCRAQQLRIQEKTGDASGFLVCRTAHRLVVFLPTV
jgi:hypothetical protein